MEKFKKLNLKNKIIFNSSIFCLACLFVLYFIVLPTIQGIKTMGKEIDNQRVDLEARYVKGYNLKQLVANLNEIRPKISSLDEIFINKSDELKFVTTLENEAEKNKIKQKINLNIPVAGDDSAFRKSALQLYTTGSFMDQLKYLIDLESLSYYINIKSLELTAGDNSNVNNNNQSDSTGSSDSADVINMSINSEIYWR